MEDNLKRLIREFDFATKEELYYHQTFFCEGLKAMIKLWISRGLRGKPGGNVQDTGEGIFSEQKLFRTVRQPERCLAALCAGPRRLENLSGGIF